MRLIIGKILFIIFILIIFIGLIISVEVIKDNMRKRNVVLTAAGVREKIARAKEDSDEKVIQRVEGLIRSVIEDAEEGRQVNDHVTVYCNRVTDEIIKYFEEKGFEVTVFYKGDGMRISWGGE